MDAMRLLETVYAGLPTGFDAPPPDRRLVSATWGPLAETYGEILPLGLQRLGRWLNPVQGDVFYDLGSGTGRTVLQMALAHCQARAVGVELSPFRHGVAVAALDALAARLRPAEASDLRARVTFRCADAAREDLREATSIYLGATCFSDDLLRAIAARAVAAPRLHRMLSARPIPPRRGLVECGSVHLPMTFSERVRLHCYARGV